MKPKTGKTKPSMKIKTPSGKPHQTKLEILIPNTTIKSQADIPGKLLGSIPCDRK